MALPRKRKKLENNSGSGFEERPARSNAAGKKGGTKVSAEKTKSSRQMDKAFEIIEQIDNHGGIPPTSTAQTNRSGQPGKIRLRISLEGSSPLPLDTANENSVSQNRAREVDVGITIPSFVWKVPILKKAVQKVMQKLSPEG